MCFFRPFRRMASLPSWNLNFKNKVSFIQSFILIELFEELGQRYGIALPNGFLDPNMCHPADDGSEDYVRGTFLSLEPFLVETLKEVAYVATTKSLPYFEKGYNDPLRNLAHG